MLQIILLVWGIVIAVRWPKLKSRTAVDCPNVDPVKFQAWHEADLRFNKSMLVASWGVLLLQLAIGFGGPYLMNIGRLPADFIDSYGGLIGVVTFLGPIIWAAILGRRALCLKAEAGIK